MQQAPEAEHSNLYVSNIPETWNGARLSYISLSRKAFFNRRKMQLAGLASAPCELPLPTARCASRLGRSFSCNFLCL